MQKGKQVSKIKLPLIWTLIDVLIWLELRTASIRKALSILATEIQQRREDRQQRQLISLQQKRERLKRLLAETESNL